jgi:hypothetical protein
MVTEPFAWQPNPSHGKRTPSKRSALNDPHNCTQPHPVATNCYLWANERPYLGYYEAAFTKINVYNAWAQVQIYDYVGSLTGGNCQHDSKGDEWAVVVTTGGGYQFTFTSECNPIHPEHIRTGQELENSGANSPWTQFEYNQWQSTSGSWNYQGNPGSPDVQSPESADWNQVPSSQYPGGVWEACSCG